MKKIYIKIDDNVDFLEFILIACSIILVILVLNEMFGFNIFNMIPTIDTDIQWGMLFLTGCNNEIIIKDFKIDKKLDVGTNEIEFTPQEEGEYIYSCWMNMIKNKIKVIDNKDYFKEEN